MACETNARGESRCRVQAMQALQTLLLRSAALNASQAMGVIERRGLHRRRLQLPEAEAKLLPDA